MDERTVTEAVVDWIGDLLDIPDAARYAYPVAMRDGPLTNTQPDVAAMVERVRTMLVAEARAVFPYQDLQQIAPLWRVYDVSASITLAPGNTEADALAVTQALQGFGKKLIESALDDARLGERVPMISPAMTADYSEIFAEDTAGITGRLVVFACTVGEPMEGIEG